MLRQNNNQKGFTIIEVVITIAIGAAVMALVLNAVQGARRAQRNTNRQADVSAIAGAVNGFSAARNALPANITPDLDNYLDELAHYPNANIHLDALPGAAVVIGAGTTGGDLGVVARDTNADNVVLIPAAQCTANSHTVIPASDVADIAAPGSVRQMVIAYRVEGDSDIFCEEI